MPKKKKQTGGNAIEEMYCNKHFKPPREQSLETIFEEPRQSKDGAPILTSVKKYKRYLHFDPTQNKIQKRKRNAKKCLKKLKINYRVTRSSPESSKSDDVSMYILNALGDISSDSDMSESNAISKKAITNSGIYTNQSSIDIDNVPCSNICDTPKRKYHDPRPSLLLHDNVSMETVNNHEHSDIQSSVSAPDTDDLKSDTVKEDAETLESPRRSCCIS